YTSPRSSPPASRFGAYRRRAWPAELTVQHTPIRHPSDHSGTSGDHDCISLGSQASTSAAPGRIRPPPLNHKGFSRIKKFRNGHEGITTRTGARLHMTIRFQSCPDVEGITTARSKLPNTSRSFSVVP